MIRDVQEAAGQNMVQQHILKAGSESQINAAFTSLVVRQAGAPLVAAGTFPIGLGQPLTAWAAYRAKQLRLA